jgi:hypothetical protein
MQPFTSEPGFIEWKEAAATSDLAKQLRDSSYRPRGLGASHEAGGYQGRQIERTALFVKAA